MNRTAFHSKAKEAKEKRTENKFAGILWTVVAGMRRYKNLTFELIGMKSVGYYLKGVSLIRRYYFSLFQTALLVGVLVFGFVMIHVGFFMFMPWSLQTKAICIMALGFVYFLGCVGGAAYLLSSKRWLKGARYYYQDMECHLSNGTKNRKSFFPEDI